jgi:Fur family ferric uptake transcriptional regulator
MILKTIETILAEMKAAGFRRSAAREAILRALVAKRKPVSVQDVAAHIKTEGKSFNKTTLYREIETLKRAGHIKELMLRNDVALYELAGPHHHHLTCVSCGDVRAVHLHESICHEERAIAKKEGFKILEHSFEFFGLCPKCV